MPAANDRHRPSLQVAAVTDIGVRRKTNQDGHCVDLAENQSAWQQRGHLLLVADGMGAHAAGEEASRLAVENIPRAYRDSTQATAVEALAESIRQTNSLIYGLGQARAEFQGMGTTLSVLALLPEGALVGQVGDSRVYRLRDGVLEQLSADHSLVWELAAAGRLPDGEVPPFVPRNVITRSLGPSETVQPDLEGIFPIQRRDRYLLCSDGLTGSVSDREIGALMACLPLAEAAQTMVDLANLRGGPDNITVVVAEWDAAKEGSQTVGGAAGEPAAKSIVDTTSASQLGRTMTLAIGLGVVLGGALLSLNLGWIVAAASVLAAGLLGYFAWFLGPANGARRRLPNGAGLSASLGEGPYRRHECPVDAEAVADLAGVVAELERADLPPGVDLDANLLQAAARSRTDREWSQALATYASAIRSLVRQLRPTQQGVLEHWSE